MESENQYLQKLEREKAKGIFQKLSSYPGY